MPNITRLDSVNSTNTYLAALAREGAPADSIVIARSQTAGRGRSGRSFVSPPGGLYLSALFRPEDSFQPGELTARCAVAVCRTLDSLGVEGSRIKWVNDVLLEGRKICGILAETVSTADGLAVVVGLGLNLSTPAEAFGGELEGKAGSILSLRGAAPEVEDMERELIRQLLSQPQPEADLDFYRSRCINIGRELLVTQGRDSFAARALSIEPDYAMRIVRNGREELLRFGEASVRGADGSYF